MQIDRQQISSSVKMESVSAPVDPLLVKYCDTFWTNFDAVVKETEHTRSELKQFINLIQSRVKIETAYAQKLHNLSKVEVKPGRVGLMQDLINAYAASLKKKSDQSKNFAHLLGQTGLDKLTHFYETVGAEGKKLKEQGKGYFKELMGVEEEYQKCLTKLDKRKKELDQLQLQFLVSATCRELVERKQSLKVKAKDKQKEYVEISKECKSAYANYTKVRKTFEKSIRHILQTYYDSEKDKFDRMIDSFVNVQLIESSECKNRLVYLEEESVFINSVKPESEIERFIDSASVLQQLSLINKPSIKESFLHHTFERLDSKKMEEVIKYGDTHKGSIRKILQDPNSLSQQESNFPSAEPLSIANYIRKMWENTLCPEDTLVFDEQINSPLSRKDFVICLQQQRILGRFEISEENIESVVSTISRVLNKCYEQKDSYAGKHILVLIFTYFTNVKEGEVVKKEYLHSFLKSNPIWKSMQFWESALIESLYQQSKGVPQVTALRIMVSNQKQQNLVFNQLAYYVYNMMLFDWQQKHVRQFATKFIKLYNLQQPLAKQVFDTIDSAKKSVPAKEATPEEVVETPSVFGGFMRMLSQKE